ncbi:3' terminal RNA ribose 2'-O-methyltransferase Hen1 [Fimbriimonas ginsengisoli]|uniref:Small RNA 2'-O-methyltransferase n=1 Tax=Fimbriimonas ginsengisoli Gsoil 348 TaxID=661478 RepID=A0A068NR50_FIMGI|nr:3' terminal RNA ribose 2'-O-methyltransferase Hen1 [Fimbriimonas ginsengisoli]AIE84039.1 double-stranded RNA 3'-methylase [Fimbriimonas ginsengisoli Gsoil 348]
MLLTITTTHRPATELGYLLRKNPERAQHAELSMGRAHLFYPEATEERCTVAVLVEVDPVALVRGSGPGGGQFDQYVNDRPYVASSFLSSAIAEFFGTAMSGTSKERPELAETPIPLRAEIPVLPARGGERFLKELFKPLGYEVTVERLPLDDQFPEWGESPYYRLVLEGEVKLQDLLKHLYVLIPVLDDRKHYYIGRAEVDKLLLRGGAWLATHPLREEISRRYLKRDRTLTREALDRLSEIDGLVEPEEQEAAGDAQEEAVERPISLHDQRLLTVLDVLKASGAKRVLDLGCGEGKLLKLLMNEKQFEEIVGMDVSITPLEKAKLRLRLERQPERKASRMKLIHGSLVYRDRRLQGYDAVAIVEVIEHLDPSRLASMERAVFEFARPGRVIVTTPNREYNALFETMEPGKLRHPDHRFEWTRAEFESWSREVADRHGYAVEFQPIGPVSEQFGAPSQMAVFQAI